MNEMTLSENEKEALAIFCLSECEEDTCPLGRYDTLDDCPNNVLEKIKNNSDSPYRRTTE